MSADHRFTKENLEGGKINMETFKTFYSDKSTGGHYSWNYQI